MSVIVCKFGGTSLADAAQIAKCRDIVRQDARRTFVVPSAPGKRSAQDIKITDMLYACHNLAHAGKAFADEFAGIRARFDDIIAALALDLDLSADYVDIMRQIPLHDAPDYVASRGEYLNGKIMAAFLGLPFFDAADIIFFDEKGNYDAAVTMTKSRDKLQAAGGGVVSAFYGSLPNGQVKTFSRGGADVSGAIVASLVDAAVYENWTDVSGFLMADPRIVANPKGISFITYRELRELSYMGATVLHEDAIFPVRNAGIPINVRNTNAPTEPGTMIMPELPAGTPTRTVTGIAGRRGYTVISIEKEMMNNEIGFARRLLSILEAHGVSFEHMPTGIDSISLVVTSTALAGGLLEAIVGEIQTRLAPDKIQVDQNIALFATVGLGMDKNRGVSGRLFSVLGQAGINVRMIAQGSGELSIIVGVEEEDFSNAITAVYEAFA